MANPRGNPQNFTHDGRPKGSRNKTSTEVADFCRNMIESREYRASLKRRLLDGKAPHMEPILFYYAYGKPVDRIELIGPMVKEVHRLSELYGMTAEEVLAEAEAIAQGRT
jgi:hypothetical protein